MEGSRAESWRKKITKSKWGILIAASTVSLWNDHWSKNTLFLPGIFVYMTSQYKGFWKILKRNRITCLASKYRLVTGYLFLGVGYSAAGYSGAFWSRRPLSSVPAFSLSLWWGWSQFLDDIIDHSVTKQDQPLQLAQHIRSRLQSLS